MKPSEQLLAIVKQIEGFVQEFPLETIDRVQDASAELENYAEGLKL